MQTALQASQRVVSVAVAAPMAEPLSYVWPDDAPEPMRGMVVHVPLGRRIVWGVVWEPTAKAPQNMALRAVAALDPGPSLPEDLMALIGFVADYTLSPLGMVVKLALPVAAALGAVPQLAAPWSMPKAAALALTADQNQAAQAIMAAQGFGVHLLDGVTGSGKTEVYFEAMAAAWVQGQTSLVLLPEIGLTPQWVARCTARFGQAPMLWHSGLTPARRREAWKAVRRGEAPVVVGARSALFLPLPALGLVVVDEEHDGSFKQEDGVLYQARDMAVARARFARARAVLASATPSLESLHNAAQGRYRHHVLPQRAGGAALPKVDLIDLRADPPEPLPTGPGWLAPPLVHAVAETLACGGQVLLYLNRRGYAPLTLCRSCGHRLACPQCDAWMVAHGGGAALQCHHCGYRTRMPKSCPDCGAEDSLTPCGPGVERVADEVAVRFPEARQAVVSSDLLRGPAAMAALVQHVEAGAVNVLIGTQMLAKGHHFPGLTLVGVVDGDLGLGGGDLRAGERTLQMLTQVAGRAGRGDQPGRVLIQTHMPDHPVMQALVRGDRDGFLALEAADREALGLPPFGRMAALILSDRDQRRVEQAARALGAAKPQFRDVQVLGPAPAPLSVLRGRHRVRFLVQTGRGTDLGKVLRAWLAGVTLAPSTRLHVDVEPYSFM